jgi:Zn-dependent protease with chaperone function
MTDQEFDALVAKLQRQSAAHPVLYRLRVLLLAALGYGYLLGAVLLLGIGITFIVIAMVALRVGFFAGRLVKPLATLMTTVLKALWVRIPAPMGIAVTRADAPALFALLDRIRAQARGPRIHTVLVTSAFNASIVQVPRLGVFGWQKNYLVLGLPLMRFVSPPEFAAVVAHETGHLVGAHGRWGAWLYRQRQSWLNLLQRLEAQRQLARSSFLEFSRWYAPLFNAYTFVMARAQEYEADRLSAAVAGSRIAADALIRIDIGGRWSDQVFWEDIRRRTRADALPPDAIFTDQASRGRDPAALDGGATLLEAALKVETSHLDTHPSLRARLTAMREEPRLPPVFDRSAAEELLGPALTTLEGAINRTWYEWALPHWKEEYEAAVAQRGRLAALQAKESTAALSTEELWERACLWSAEERDDESAALVEQLVATAPEFAPAQSTWGMILLGRGEDAGLQFIDRALALGGIDPRQACAAAHGYLIAHGRPAEAQRYVDRIAEYDRSLMAAQEERRTFGPHDATEPHGFDEAQLEALRVALRKHPQVKSAALVRKRLKHFPESPVYVLGIRIRKEGWGRLQTQAIAVRKALLTQLQFSSVWVCYSLDLLTAVGAKRFEDAAGGPFYRAER